MTRRETIIERILAERVRQFDLPGTEYDVTNSPNDWAAIAASYLLRSVSRKNKKPFAGDYEQDLVMAAAVILAGLEHLDQMKEKEQFEKPLSLQHRVMPTIIADGIHGVSPMVAPKVTCAESIVPCTECSEGKHIEQYDGKKVVLGPCDVCGHVN